MRVQLECQLSIPTSGEVVSLWVPHPAGAPSALPPGNKAEGLRQFAAHFARQCRWPPDLPAK